MTNEKDKSGAKIPFSKRVPALYDSDKPTQPKMTVAEKVRVLYDDSRPNSAIKNGQAKSQQPNPNASAFSVCPKKLESCIKYYECLSNLLTAAALVMLLFTILVPVFAVVLAVYKGVSALNFPGFLAPIVFLATLICVLLARSRSRKLNRMVLFITLLIFCAVSCLVSIGLLVVGVIGLLADSPAPYGRGTGFGANIMEILSMHCAIASSGAIVLIASVIMLAISIHFTRGACAQYGTTDTDADEPVAKGRRSSSNVMPILIAPSPGRRSPTPLLDNRSSTPQATNGPIPTVLLFPTADHVEEEMAGTKQARRPSGTGRPTSGSGRPTTGPGRPNSGSSRPTSGPGRPTSGSGRPTSGAGRSESETSIGQIVVDEVDDSSRFDEGLQLPDSRRLSLTPSSRRWGKTKNVLRAIMDIKQ